MNGPGGGWGSQGGSGNVGGSDGRSRSHSESNATNATTNNKRRAHSMDDGVAIDVTTGSHHGSGGQDQQQHNKRAKLGSPTLSNQRNPHYTQHQNNIPQQQQQHANVAGRHPHPHYPQQPHPHYNPYPQASQPHYSPSAQKRVVAATAYAGFGAPVSPRLQHQQLQQLHRQQQQQQSPKKDPPAYKSAIDSKPAALPTHQVPAAKASSPAAASSNSPPVARPSPSLSSRNQQQQQQQQQQHNPRRPQALTSIHTKSDPDGFVAREYGPASHPNNQPTPNQNHPSSSNHHSPAAATAAAATASFQQSSKAGTTVPFTPVVKTPPTTAAKTAPPAKRQEESGKGGSQVESSNGNNKTNSNSNSKPATGKTATKQKRSSSKSPRASPTDEDQPPPRMSRRLSKNADPSIGKKEIVSTLLELPTLSNHATLVKLTNEELKALEVALELMPGDAELGWRDDWSGNLALFDKEVINPKNAARAASKGETSQAPEGSFRQPLYTWAQKSNTIAMKYLFHLFRYVYHLPDTPHMARVILANADRSDTVAMETAFRRVSYDPIVLREDGWVTAKAPEPEGATGGSNRIGENVRWQGADGIVIAYVHDDDMGDLWRCLWTEEGMESFDLEAEELIDARKKWNRRSKSAASKGKDKDKDDKKKWLDRRSHRYTATSDIKITGVEHGIVLAASFARGARPGVYWPARVMHASEATGNLGVKNKRSAPRQRLDLVFLAPYWNSKAGPTPAAGTTSSRKAVESFSESLVRHGESLFSSGPLFDVESVDVTEEMIKEYPYDGRDAGVNIEQLRAAFRFSGLPKAAFRRYLDSHRLALALKTYAQEELPPRGTDFASAGLFETHPMSLTAPQFPPEVLHLPYTFILSQLPAPLSEQNVHDGEERSKESVLRLNTMIEALKPPNCWGQEKPHNQNGATPAKKKPAFRVAESPHIDAGALLRKSAKAGAKPVDMKQFTKDLLNLQQAMVGCSLGLAAMFATLEKLVSSVTPAYASLSPEEKLVKAQALTRSWMFAKTNGEDALAASVHAKTPGVLAEWRRLCERIYKYITHAFSATGYGNGVSAVLTDFRCNQHVTSCGCFERTVRLPAALKAARDVGAGTSDNVQLSTSVEKSYLETAENKVLMKAHSTSYLRRMKARCSQIQGDNIEFLTEDSEGNGGEDTKGTRGTWMAAVASVGAAIKAVDMVVEGQCVNVFCATRPPGHHAGRQLHAMKAVSNGFCIINTAACAALHATTPLAEGGPGLRRVCVIDFDVHHGNGTQDILCSTYDPRFLYVSLHAGGAHVNGLPATDDFDNEIHSPGGNTGKRGIYPGRCGDSSPHPGVLNIPLGPRVTSHAVGTALINEVTPAVEAFSPDLIILSAGFDAHKHDPLGLGGLSAEDFGHITDVTCQLASKCCSGRLISLLEGGYGVPCCRPQRDLFLPPPKKEETPPKKEEKKEEPTKEAPKEPIKENGADESAPQSESQPMDIDKPEPEPPVPEKEQEPAKPPQSTNPVAESPEPEKEKDPATPPQSTKPEPESPVPEKEKELAKPPQSTRPQPSKLLELGDDLPEDMEDQVPYALQRRLEKCHQEGFIECVRGHVASMIKCNKRS